MDGSIDNKELIDKLANLLNETAEAHHKAFATTEGEDPRCVLAQVLCKIRYKPLYVGRNVAYFIHIAHRLIVGPIVLRST
jgi:hypothetical protein